MRSKRYPYWEWEDYVAGLYKLAWGRYRTTADAVAILEDPDQLRHGMELAVRSWPRAATHHLTDASGNHQAWLGWAACGILAEIPAHLTRAAWWLLNDEQRANANGVADEVFLSYCQRNAEQTSLWSVANDFN